MSGLDGFALGAPERDRNGLFAYRLQRGALVFPRAADIFHGLRRRGNPPCRLLDRVLPDFLSDKKRSRIPRRHRRQSRGAHRNARRATNLASIHGKLDRHAGHGEIAGAALELDVGAPLIRRRSRQDHLADKLIMIQSRRVGIDEKGLSVEAALAARADAANARLERQSDGPPVSSRVGLRQRPADGAPVSHLTVAEHADGIGHERKLMLDQARLQNALVRRKGADPQTGCIFLHIGESAQPADVDQPTRAREAKFQQRQQALSPGQELCLFAAGRKHIECLFQGIGNKVFKRSGVHRDWLQPTNTLRLFRESTRSKDNAGCFAADFAAAKLSRGCARNRSS